MIASPFTAIQANTFKQAVALGRAEGEAWLAAIRIGCRMAEINELSTINHRVDHRSDAVKTPAAARTPQRGSISKRDRIDVKLDHANDQTPPSPCLDLAETRRTEPKTRLPSLWDEYNATHFPKTKSSHGTSNR